MHPKFIVVKRTVPPCAYCTQVVNTLIRRGYDFETVELETCKEFFKENGLTSVPQVFVEEIDMKALIGGADKFRQYMESLDV